MFKKQDSGRTVPCNFMMINFVKDVISIEKEIHGDINIFLPIERNYDVQHSRPYNVQDVYALFVSEKQRKAHLRKQKKKDKILLQKTVASTSKKKKS